MKQLLKRLLKYFPVPLTQNIRYDRLTQQVIRRACRPDSNCIDVGCHKGEIMDLMNAAAPDGRHWGFEPIPDLFRKLQEKYRGTNVTVSDVALSDRAGEATFNYVVSNPSYSGLMKRKYDRQNEKDTTITVKTGLLDEVLPGTYRADLMKIDVEGGEMGVLLGARRTIARCRPVIIFEHGIGASDIYGTTPEQLFGFFTGLGYYVTLLDRWLKAAPPFTAKEFSDQYYGRKNFYFLAYPGPALAISTGE